MTTDAAVMHDERTPLDRRRTLSVAGSLMLLGSLCPWASALGLVAVSGLSLKLGWLTLAAGLSILLLHRNPGRLQGIAAVQAHRRTLIRGAAGLSMLACLFVILGVSSAGYGLVEPSWGCFLTLLSAGAAFWAANRSTVA